MKLGKLASPAFAAAFSNLMAQTLPGRAAFKLKGVLADIQKEGKKYNSTRKESIKRLCILDEKREPVVEDNRFVFPNEDNQSIFEKEMLDLHDLDVEVRTVKLDDLGDKFEISTQDMFLLEDVIKE